MKAVVLNGYGGNEKLALAEVEKPTPGPDEVLIKVSHAGLNPLDYKIRKGDLRMIRKLRFPQVMGNEAAGVVESCGANVKAFKPGDKVYTRVDKTKLGTFAEYMTEPQANVAIAPRSVAPEVAAGIPLVALTAWQCLNDLGKIQRNQTILIHGGAGSVGRFAIQFAKRAGAHVTATGSGTSRAIATQLGADQFIDYKTEKFDAGGARYDLVLDLVGGETLDRSFAVVKQGGMVISIAGAPEPETARAMGAGFALRTMFALISRKQRGLAAKAGAQYRFLFMHPDGAQLAQFASWIDAGTLHASIDKVFSAKQFAEAFAYQESGKAKGKIVIASDF